MTYEILLRFFLAALWGGIVGAEREYRSKSAGFRTMILISLGSCFFTIMSMDIGYPQNMDRIASNIVTGIGFLGAGVIFRGEWRINGITTAATIWAVAAVGMGIGAGYYWTSAAASILIIIILAALPYIESGIDRLNQTKSYSIQADVSDQMLEKYENAMKAYGLKYKIMREQKKEGHMMITWQVYGHASCHKKFAAFLRHDKDTHYFDF